MLFAVHGLPESLQQDTRFKSEFWCALTRLLGLHHKINIAFHAQTDGQRDRVNGVLEDYIVLMASIPASM